MGFMEPDVEFMSMFSVLTTYCDSCLVPAELVSESPSAEELQDYVEGTVRTREDGSPDAVLLKGWFARLSAPGYLDCTDWMGPYDTEEEAINELTEFYELDEDEESEDEEEDE